MKEISSHTIIRYLIFLVIITTTSIIGLYTTWKINKDQQQVIIVKQAEKVCQFPDFNAIKGKNPDPGIKRVIIAQKFVNNLPVSLRSVDGVTKTFQVKGEFSRAYLYVEAKVDFNRPLTVWDDVYFKINDKGGHLVPDINNLAEPSSNISRYLYDLRSIYYYPKVEEKKKAETVNMYDFLADNNKLRINAFISSNRPGGTMEEVSIYYECLKGSSCSIQQ